MKAIGIKQSLPVSNPNSFIEFETATPKPSGRDILVKVEAVSVNPVDYKIRQSAAKGSELAEPKILGWDAVGTVAEVGDETSLFKGGDKVFYAGDITRPGSDAEYQLVDERIAGHAPKTKSIEDIAAMPLTALTAWEIFFDRMRISKEKDRGKSLLIIGGAGGVGSIAIQYAKKIAGLTVLATASRTESMAWCKALGADHIVNHKTLVDAVHQVGYKEVDFIVDFVDTNHYWDAITELIKPQGHIGSITGSSNPIALEKLKTKSASFSWELMYTRSMFQTNDMIEQHNILNHLSSLLDDGTITTTLKKTFRGFTVDNFRKAHEMLEDGSSIGKIVITSL